MSPVRLPQPKLDNVEKCFELPIKFSYQAILVALKSKIQNPQFYMSDANSIQLAQSVPSELSSQSTALVRQQAREQIRNSLRPGQQQMADWQGGALAVSAVPGAGKSTGMAAAAALAIARYHLHARRSLIVVTFTRSAAANIKAKIRKYLREDLSLPLGGFAVHTLHGLALNIANRHPDISGINLDNAILITPNQSHRFIRTCVEQWIASYPQRYSQLLEGRQFDGEETERLRRQSVLRTEVLPELARTVIHEAKKLWSVASKIMGTERTDHRRLRHFSDRCWAVRAVPEFAAIT